MTSEGLHQRKCKECSEWVDAKVPICPNCGTEFNQQYRQEIAKRKSESDIHIPIWQVKEDDPIWLKIAKRPIQLVQLMLYSIVAFFIYLSTAFAH